MITDQTKNLLEFLYKNSKSIFSGGDAIMISGEYIPKKEIEFFIDKNLDLNYLTKLRNYNDKFIYHEFSKNDINNFLNEKNIEEYKDLVKFCEKNNINKDYYGIISPTEIYNEYKKEKEEKEKQEEFKKQEKISHKKGKFGYIYLIESFGKYKIGATINITKRKKKYQVENPGENNLIFCEYVKDYFGIEEQIKNHFFSKNHRGEWFNFDLKDIEEIKRMVENHKNLFNN